jgi:orotidine-5'-phosphate decarboxylase
MPELKPHLLLKIGLNTFVAGGPEFVRRAKAKFDVVLDLKLPDIPNTNASTAKRIAELGVDMFTVKGDVGMENIREIKRAITGPDFPNPPKILVVTALTSMSEETCKRIFKRSPRRLTKFLVEEAMHGGADGIVCSPLELPRLKGWVAEMYERQGPPPPFITFIPGIELAPRQDDQKRKGGLKEVVEGGADIIVVGRPIYQSKNPVEKAVRLIAKIAALQKLREQYEEEAKWTD